MKSKKSSIKLWSEVDRPREKLMTLGKNALSDAELIAILLGSGNRNESAVDLAKNILRNINDNLIELSKLDIKKLCRFKGIGEAKALSIIAAMELGNRRRYAEVIEREKVSSSKDAFEIFLASLADKAYEEFWILLLNRANRILKKLNISEGGISGTVADPKKIFKLALDNNASSIILCHNHPSGNIQPSESDVKLTNKLKDAGKLLDLPVIDHIIIGEDKYYSFADEGGI
ncbi:MAG: DNA repair protein RadC [Bacteroidales bacterium]|nr:DNA repair protein RadC [Bacteroidales bacterium]